MTAVRNKTFTHTDTRARARTHTRTHMCGMCGLWYDMCGLRCGGCGLWCGGCGMCGVVVDGHRYPYCISMLKGKYTKLVRFVVPVLTFPVGVSADLVVEHMLWCTDGSVLLAHNGAPRRLFLRPQRQSSIHDPPTTLLFSSLPFVPASASPHAMLWWSTWSLRSSSLSEHRSTRSCHDGPLGL
jgi:hypothetical protein